MAEEQQQEQQEQKPEEQQQEQQSAWGDDWRQRIAGDNEKELKLLERYDSPAAVWRKARSLEQRISSGELRSNLPKDAKPEEVSRWREENGIPEKPDAYDLGDWQDEGQKESVLRLAEMMHGTNANKAQVKAAAEWAKAELTRAEEAMSARDEEIRTSVEDELRSEWGADYRRNINLVNSLLDTGPAGLKDAFLNGRTADGTPLASHPDMLRWLTSLARQINPVTTAVPGVGGDQMKGVEDEIASIEKLMRDNRKEYNRDASKQTRYRELLEYRMRHAK